MTLLRPALAAFLTSRLLFFVLLILGAQIQFLEKVEGGSVWMTRIVFIALFTLRVDFAMV